MRIHVLGREYDALRSAESFLQTAKAERSVVGALYGFDRLLKRSFYSVS